MRIAILFLALLGILPGVLQAQDFRAGLARRDITPAEPIWLSGYASRTKPSEGVSTKIWIKALSLDDGKKGRVVIVTSDLIGIPRWLSDSVAARVQKEFGLPRSAMLLNASHTHTGPVVWPNLVTMWNLDAATEQQLKAYAKRLENEFVAAIGGSLANTKPVRVEYSVGQAGFAVNRRQPTPQGVKIGVNPQGPVDHSVPVLRVVQPDGQLMAVVFGYACHNTTLGGDIYQVTGDYAGFAQAELERLHPEAQAMFLMLCGADQNPNPRGKLEHAQQYGKQLAEAVHAVLAKPGERVRGRIRTVFRTTELALRPHTREDFEKLAKDPLVARKKLAESMLKAYDERHPPRSVLYPAQSIRLGDRHAILALGGEVVIDYALRAKREYPKLKLIVAGYSNDVMCYIPSRRVLEEGGYEAVDSMVYYGQPAPFTSEVEESVFGLIRAVMK
jgi:neutral ceramidase